MTTDPGLTFNSWPDSVVLPPAVVNLLALNSCVARYQRRIGGDILRISKLDQPHVWADLNVVYINDLEEWQRYIDFLVSP